MSDELIPKIFEKVEKIADDVGSLKVTSAVHEETLRIHVKRSTMVEELYNTMKKEDIEPLKADMAQIKGIYKFVIFLSVLATIALVFVEYFKK